MTKVKTILAEFCSPKDILAINRLGLLKKEERENQPIPWRHRLPNAERRELVKSEMRMSLRPSRSRVNSRDKAKAFQSAANPNDSRMGESLYNIHIREDPYLSSSLFKIEREQSRLEASQKHHRQQFLSKSHSLTHEPLLLVEREPSQTVKTRAMLMRQHGIDPQVLMKPSYMRPLESHSHTPSTIITIDAFVAETKKKRNVWEMAMDEVDPTKFRSAARPYTRLNDRELQQLRVGHALHKPRPDAFANTLFPQRPALPPEQTSPRQSRRPKIPGADDEFTTEESVFITQRSVTDSGEGKTPSVVRAGEVSEEHGATGKYGLKNPMTSRSGGVGTVNKTVTFAGLPPTPKKSSKAKYVRPVTVATDRGSSPARKAKIAQRPRPNSLTDKDRIVEAVDLVVVAVVVVVVVVVVVIEEVAVVVAAAIAVVGIKIVALVVIAVVIVVVAVVVVAVIVVIVVVEVVVLLLVVVVAVVIVVVVVEVVVVVVVLVVVVIVIFLKRRTSL
ncbi:hypothetical protein ElyMa_004104900 [Elysia marginata]|uniref:Uncharacterized protein n=1 Tax=Elysia marginata TaxID=1093978 RepID=A0AAV4GAK3_9GAST|nr:hypothetical protein ElyMa_004104900 [Elysia marginata]